MNIFVTPVTHAYDLTDATWEIIIMLLVAFLLGWLFSWFWNNGYGKSEETHVHKGEFAQYIKDDLKIVEGIGPKIEELLKEHGVTTWEKLAHASVSELRTILAKGGDRFTMHDPSSWADQAALANEGKWDDLRHYQSLLLGGRVSA